MFIRKYCTLLKRLQIKKFRHLISTSIAIQDVHFRRLCIRISEEKKDREFDLKQITMTMVQLT